MIENKWLTSPSKINDVKLLKLLLDTLLHERLSNRYYTQLQFSVWQHYLGTLYYSHFPDQPRVDT